MEFKERLKNHLLAYRKRIDKNQEETAVLLNIGYRTYQDIEGKGIVKSAIDLVSIVEKTGFEITKEIAQPSNFQEHLRDFKNGNNSEGIKMYESAPVAATVKTVYHDEHNVPDYVLQIPQFRDCNYGTRASGDSMYPEIRNGDLVICKELDRNSRIIFGDIYIVHTKDNIETIKYIKAHENLDWVTLVPHNKAAGVGTPIPKNEIIKLFKVRAVFKAY